MGELNMVIQGYNVSVSSQRSSISVNTAGMSASANLNSANFARATDTGGGTTALPNQNSNNGNNNSNGNNGNIGNGQLTNGNGNNNGNIGNGQLTNGNGNNNGNIGNGQLTNGNGNNNGNIIGQTQNQSKGDIFRTMLENSRDKSVNRLARENAVSQMHGAKHHKMPTTPQELRARFSQLIYEMLTGRLAKSKMKPHHGESPGDYHQSLDISMFFSGGAIGHGAIGHGAIGHGAIGHGALGHGAFGHGALGLGAMQQIQGIPGLRIESFEYEYESISYQANGIVHTADGKTITVDIDMQLSREFVSFMGITGKDGLPVDPLVINYGGTLASLTGEKFSFDLTMDGEMDSLSVLTKGSGFLAIDWNGDGKINDGSELFGPTTGCGFSELRKYDTDGNGWIDTNDEIFDKLVVWSRDKDGNDTVYTLAELGIGAIFLGEISTEFSFKGERNETLGVMRSTSFFLKQCGGAGTLSHIDLMTAS